MNELNRAKTLTIDTIDNVNKPQTTLLECLKNKQENFPMVDELYLPPIDSGDNKLIVPRYWATVEEIREIFETITKK